MRFPDHGPRRRHGGHNYFGHTISACGGRDVFDMVSAGGVPDSAAAENIGWMAGSTDPTTAAKTLHGGSMNEHRVVCGTCTSATVTGLSPGLRVPLGSLFTA